MKAVKQNWKLNLKLIYLTISSKHKIFRINFKTFGKTCTVKTTKYN